MEDNGAIPDMKMRLYTAREVAAALGISHSTIYTLVKKRVIPHHRIVSKIFFTMEDVEGILPALQIEPEKR